MHKGKKLKDRVVTIEKQPTWSEIITALNVGDNFPILMTDANYVRSEISSTIRLKYPDMQFHTRRQKEDGIDYLLIERKR